MSPKWYNLASARSRLVLFTECIILRGFRRVMKEYGVTKADQVRAVATSSGREAIEEPEETRLTCVAVQNVVSREAEILQKDALIVEVGGGRVCPVTAADVGALL